MGSTARAPGSWNVYVKEGLITWESQAVDYPSTGPEMPEYEPRGCPRGASFSWYTDSPLRLKYPYVRGSLLQMFREARARLGDPLWLPVLLLAEVLRPRLRYDVRRWSTVFPVGMYAACSFGVGQAARTSAITSFARVWVWVALAFWTAVLAGMIRRTTAVAHGEQRPTGEDSRDALNCRRRSAV